MSREDFWASCLIVVIVPAVIFTPRQGLRELLLGWIPQIWITADQWKAIAIVFALGAAALMYLVGAVFVRQYISRRIAIKQQQGVQEELKGQR